jgi:hypothetical protein
MTDREHRMAQTRPPVLPLRVSRNMRYFVVFEDNWFDLVPGHPKRVAVLFGSVRSVIARAVNAAPILIST